MTNDALIEVTADIVKAAVSSNYNLAVNEITALIADVHGALTRIANGNAQAPAAELLPAVPIKGSVKPDYIICLEDGKRFKSLKRHLATYYNMTPNEYRAKWGLPDTYPMVAPNYAKLRAELAKKIGLGRKPGKRTLRKAA